MEGCKEGGGRVRWDNVDKLTPKKYIKELEEDELQKLEITNNRRLNMI